MYSFHHELAIKRFSSIIKTLSPPSLPSPPPPSAQLTLSYCHLLIAYSHGPNYNFATSTGYFDLPYTNQSRYPSRSEADIHIALAADLARRLVSQSPANRTYVHLLNLTEAISLRCFGGVSSAKFGQIKLKSASLALGVLYDELLSLSPPSSPSPPSSSSSTSIDELTYFLVADSLLLLSPWKFYSHPSRTPTSPPLESRVRKILESGLSSHPSSLGLSHLYIHLSEMSPSYTPSLSPPLSLACKNLRTAHGYPHLLHMPTHIDVQVGEWEASVTWNGFAIEGDMVLRETEGGTSGAGSFYDGYAYHDFHMAVWSCLMGGFEKEGRRICELWERKFVDYENVRKNPETAYGRDGQFGNFFMLLMRFGRFEEMVSAKVSERALRNFTSPTHKQHDAPGLAKPATVSNFDRLKTSCV